VVPALTDVAALAGAVRDRRRFLDRQAGRAQRVAADGLAVEAAIARLEFEVDVHAKTSAMLTTIGEQAQESARGQFEALATQALQYIFGEEFSFRFEPGESGGQATLEPLIWSRHGSQMIETTVTDARGGGMAAVIGFVLQLVMVKLSPKVRDIMFLDEPFAFVSEAYAGRLAEFLREVADRIGVQLVMITHDRVYAEHADVRVRFALGRDGMTQVFEGEVE
jgi:hypothetical protein